MHPQQKVYLGDGVFMAIQPGELVLTTENGLETTNRIVFDGVVFAMFLERLRDALNVDITLGDRR